MAVPDEEIEEVFKLFDQDGSGIKIKEIGTVMRSLGLAASEAQLREFRVEAEKKDPAFVQFPDFLGYVKRMETVEATKSSDVAKELEGMKVGLLYFFDKLTSKQIRESPPDSIKMADLKHIMSSVGEKMTEEEIEEMAREIRASCKMEVEAQSRFRDIAEAYDVLIDPLRRQQFDAHGEVGLKNPPHGTDFEPYQYVGDPFELFNQFFSSADPLSVAYEPELEDLPVLPSMPKEPTIEMEIECTLGELKEGNTRCVVVERTRLGPGFIPYQEKKPVTLPIKPGWQAGMRIIFKGAGNHSHKDNQCDAQGRPRAI
ncbi:PCM1 [Symbiodinium pilosum]|uniref:PCM1 protein n=1 Tax=Symbiodinium pilosum TaxID=2952 RepID=A0A812N2I8_SYMPI|nr:PCM1 [Symbiodinium pilosum]